mgnify:CR=1 FL=1
MWANIPSNSSTLWYLITNLPEPFFGVPKEARGFWQQLTARTNLKQARTALIDDNPSVLAAAKAYGLAGLIAISQPNSKKPAQPVPGYQNVCFLNELIER